MVQYNQQPSPFVPGAYILNQTPQPVISGVGSGQVDIVGVASWGPVNSVGNVSPQNAAQLYGPVTNRSRDLMTAVAVAALPGALIFKTVRVTDSTDVAASAVLYGATAVVTAGGGSHAINDVVTYANGAQVKVNTVSSGAIATFTITALPTANTGGAIAQTATTGSGTGSTLTFTYTTGLTATSFYTGSLANGDTVQIAAGSAANSLKAVVTRSGQTPEVFDNLATGLANNAAWVAIATAINSGTAIRGPSAYIVASAGASTITPLPQTYTLASGTDGASSVSDTTLIGVDGASRTGMYALRGTGPATLVLADGTSTTWAPAAAFCASEGLYGMVSGTSGEYTNLTTVATNKASIDTTALKVLVGDYLYFADATNNIPNRLVQPSAFAAGLFATLTPAQSGLNKPIQGIVGSQSKAAGHVYSQSELSVLGQNGLDLIASPSPGGSYFSLQQGLNASSNAAVNGDNYSRMIGFLDASFAQVAGRFVGLIQTVDEQNQVMAVFDAFLFGLWKGKPPLISNPAGTQPYKLQLVATPNQQAAGYQILSIAVQLGPIVRIFQINVQAGQTVQIVSATTQAAA